MSQYLMGHGTKVTPQSKPIPGSDQVANSAGGFAWAVDCWTRLNRFLILGSEGGSYYADERTLTTENVQAVRECIAEDGPRTVQTIVDVSHAGRAPKNDPALFALASCISLGDKATKRAAAEALPQVARIGTHLYNFVAYAETMRGWGRTMRWAISNWYTRNPEQLAFQAVKYRQRNGWSHRDLLRLAHPKNDENAAIFNWIVRNEKTIPVYPTLPDAPLVDIHIIEGFEKAQRAESPAVTAALVREYKLPREALQTEHLNDPEVWRAMLDTGMPLHAMTRNLATMTRAGIFDSMEYRKVVVDTLGDAEKIHKSRLHPMAILIALSTYAAGRGFRGSNTWQPNGTIVDALDAAFYLAFDNVTPTGKRHLLALDVSGSMGGGMVGGSPLAPREAAAAMALVTNAVEDNVDIVTFSCGGAATWTSPHNRQRFGGYRDGLEPFSITRRSRLDDVVAKTRSLRMGGTDCALPMVFAKEAKREYDAFVVYTDSETWFGDIHPMQALQQYRNHFVPNAKLIVVGMVSNGFSIADPNDAGAMDVVGFDTAAPALMADFVRGAL